VLDVVRFLSQRPEPKSSLICGEHKSLNLLRGSVIQLPVAHVMSRAGTNH
jgi:hypothetical protein